MRDSGRKVVFLCLVALWCQLSFAPAISIWGVVPDFIYLVFAFLVFFSNRQKIICLAFGVGIAKDLFSNTFFGLETIGLVSGVLILNQIVKQFDREDFRVQMWATFLCSLSGLTTFLVVFAVVQDKVLITSSHILRSFFIAVYTVFLVPLIFPFLKSFFAFKSPVKQYELF